MDQGQGNISLRGGGWRSLDGGACIPVVGIAGAPGREVELCFLEQLLASGQGAGGGGGETEARASESQSIEGADKLTGCTQAWKGAKTRGSHRGYRKKGSSSREASRGG